MGAKLEEQMLQFLKSVADKDIMQRKLIQREGNLRL